MLNKITLKKNPDSDIYCSELSAITNIEFTPAGYKNLVKKILKVCVRAENLKQITTNDLTPLLAEELKKIILDLLLEQFGKDEAYRYYTAIINHFACGSEFSDMDFNGQTITWSEIQKAFTRLKYLTTTRFAKSGITTFTEK